MNIYVSNLSYDVTDADLRELFEEFGAVSSAKVIMDRISGRSRGFGFVEMPDNDQGQKAIEELDNCEYSGKYIKVNVAKPKTEGSGGRFSNRGGGNRDGFNSSRRNSRY